MRVVPVRERARVGDQARVGLRQDRGGLAQTGELGAVGRGQHEQRRAVLGDPEEVAVGGAQPVDGDEVGSLTRERHAVGPDDNGARSRVVASGRDPRFIRAAISGAIQRSSGERDGFGHPSSVRRS